MAFGGISLAGTVGLFLILTALTIGVAGFMILAFWADIFPVLAAMTFFSALSYSLLMELWYWATKQRSFAVILYSSFVGSIANLLMIFSDSPFGLKSEPLNLAFFSACGAIIGVVVGSLDWLGQILSTRAAPIQPDQDDPA